MRTLSNVSKCHFLSGAKRSAASTIFDEHTALNSGSDRSRNMSNSLIITLILLPLTRAKLNSIARRRIDTSGSFKHSRIVERCLCTALVSKNTVFSNVFNATYLKKKLTTSEVGFYGKSQKKIPMGLQKLREAFSRIFHTPSAPSVSRDIF